MILMNEKYWDDFVVGETFQTGSVTVTETHMVNFAGITGDYYPLHADEEYCKKNTIFNSRIVHGTLTLSIAFGLVVQSNFLGDSVIALASVEKIELKKPVKPGDTIKVEILVDSKKEISKEGRGITNLIYTVINQHNSIVLTMKANLLMKKILNSNDDHPVRRNR